MEITGLGSPMSKAAIQFQAAGKTDSFQATLENAVKDKDKAELMKACKSFESYYVQMTLKEMRKTVHSEEGLFPKGQAETMFQEMLDEEFSKEASKGKGIGIADMMYKQLSRDLT